MNVIGFSLLKEICNCLKKCYSCIETRIRL